MTTPHHLQYRATALDHSTFEAGCIPIGTISQEMDLCDRLRHEYGTYSVLRIRPDGTVSSTVTREGAPTKGRHPFEVVAVFDPAAERLCVRCKVSAREPDLDGLCVDCDDDTQRFA